MIPFTDKTKMKQFVCWKTNPTGLKNVVSVNKKGLVLDYCIYQEKGSTFETNNKYSLTIGESAVVYLSQSVPPGSCLYTRNKFRFVSFFHTDVQLI